MQHAAATSSGEYSQDALTDFLQSRSDNVTYQELRERFPSPIPGNRPGEYSTDSALEAAKLAVYWARDQALMLADGQRFPSPRIGNGPIDPRTEGEVEAARRAIMWSRTRGQVGEVQGERLKFIALHGPDDMYDSAWLKGDKERPDLSQPHTEARALFPSPKLGTLTPFELVVRQRDIHWARKTYMDLADAGRFPERPAAGPGVANASLAIVRERVREQLEAAERSALEKFFAGNGATGCLYHRIGGNSRELSDFAEGAGQQRFPSPVLGDGPGAYASVADLELAKRAVLWARGVCALSDDLPSPPLGNGRGEFATPEQVEAAKRAIVWSRAQGVSNARVAKRLGVMFPPAAPAPCHEGEEKGAEPPVVPSSGSVELGATSGGRSQSQSRPQSGEGGEFDEGLFAEFAEGKAGKDLTWDELRRRFPSPAFGKGPGEYPGAQEYEAAKRAVLWARKRTQRMAKGDRFHPPKLGSGPGRFATVAELEGAVRAIVSSRLRGVERERERAGARSDGEDENDDDDEDEEDEGPDAQARRWKEAAQRFPSPVLGNRPGEYSCQGECEVATRAVRWARAQFANRRGEGGRFPSPMCGCGPGEFADEAALEAAKRAIVWSLQRGMVRETSQERLRFLLESGADRVYSRALLSDCSFNHGRAWDEWFPSPVLGKGLGECPCVGEFERARNAVRWAREQAQKMLVAGERRFPSPKLGTGPGEPATEAALEAAKRAIVWSRLRGQVRDAENARLAFLESQGADGAYDRGLLRALTARGPRSSLRRRRRRRASLRERFPSPSFGAGPGECSTQAEYEAARRAVCWARQRAVALSPGERFPSPTLGDGFATEAELRAAKATVRWARLRGQVERAAEDRVRFLAVSGVDRAYDRDVLSDFGKLVGSALDERDAVHRFPSPVLGSAVGEYATAEALERARDAVGWARGAALELQEGEPFPSPKLGGSPVEGEGDEAAVEAAVEAAEAQEAAKRAVMWSRLRGQVAEAKQQCLKFLRDNPNHNDYDAAFLSDLSDAGRYSLWREAIQRFPSPTLGLGPRQFASLDEFEAARRAVRRARDAFVDSGGEECVYEPDPSDFASAEELDAAYRAVGWGVQPPPPPPPPPPPLPPPPQQQPGQGGEVPHAGLAVDNGAGAGAYFEYGILGGLGGPGGGGLFWADDKPPEPHDLGLDPRDRFPSPVLGMGPGECGSMEELEEARRAVYWARAHWDPERPDAFPSPKLGSGPGEYATLRELETALRAIMWADLQGQISLAQLERLSCEEQSERAAADERFPPNPSDLDGQGAWLCAGLDSGEELEPLEAQQEEEGEEGEELEAQQQEEGEDREAYWARMRSLEEMERYYSAGIQRFDWWD